MASFPVTMFGTRPEADDAMSTVTSLFTKAPKRGGMSEAVKNLPHTTVPVGVCSDKTYFSSTKLLSKYIHDYDKDQTIGLAKSLTEHRKKEGVIMKTPVKPTKGRENEINKEIKLAKRLLPQNYTGDVSGDMQSLTTDDLLVSNPYEGILNEVDLVNSYDVKQCVSQAIDCQFVAEAQLSKRKSHSKQSMRSKENTDMMHYSDISTQHSLVDGLDESVASFNLYSLNGVSYTPHKIKYKSVYSGSLPSAMGRSRGDHNPDCESGKVHAIGGGIHSLAMPSMVNLPTGASRSKGKDACCSCQCIGDHRCSSPSPTNLITSRSSLETPVSHRQKKYAGRTPYRPDYCHRIVRHPNTTDETEVTLSGERSWEDSLALTLSSTSSVGETMSQAFLPLHMNDKATGIHEFVEECLDGDMQDGKPGAVETLKNMLFTLQSISPSASREDLSMAHTSKKASINADENMTHGYRSLKLAMAHLSNLKDFVGPGDATS